MRNLRTPVLVGFLAVAFSLAPGQDQDYSSCVVHPNQEISVQNLHLRTAASDSSTAALVASLETVLDNPQLCCGKASAFSEIPDLAGHPSLEDIGARLNGKHVLGDGSPVIVDSEYISSSSITSYQLVALLKKNQPLLMQWNSHVFVLEGLTTDEKICSDGRHEYVIRKLLLLDPSSASASHTSVFDRSKDNWSDVEGFLLLKTS